MLFTRHDIIAASTVKTATKLCIIMSKVGGEYGYKVGYTQGKNLHGPMTVRVQYRQYDSTEMIAYFANKARRAGTTKNYNAQRDAYIKILKEIECTALQSSNPQ